MKGTEMLLILLLDLVGLQGSQQEEKIANSNDEAANISITEIASSGTNSTLPTVAVNWSEWLTDYTVKENGRIFRFDIEFDDSSPEVLLSDHRVQENDTVEVNFVIQPVNKSFTAGIAFHFKSHLAVVVDDFHVDQGMEQCIEESEKSIHMVYIDPEEMMDIYHACERAVLAGDDECEFRCNLITRVAQMQIRFNPSELHTLTRTKVRLKYHTHILETPAIMLAEHQPLDLTSGYVSSYLFDGTMACSRRTEPHFFLILQDNEVLLLTLLHVDLGKQTHFSVGRSSRLPSRKVGFYLLTFDHVYIFDELRFDISKLSNNDRFLMFSYSLLITFSTFEQVTISEYCGRIEELTTGFKLFYSRNYYTEIPRRITNSLYNCSVPYYSSFERHFRCNLHVECINGEDEENCPYSSTACGSGLIDAGNKCLLHITVQKGKLSWDEAFTMCKKRKMRLVSPKTEQEWVELRKILTYTTLTTAVFVGLRTSELLAYSHVWEGVDNTMAFYNKIWTREQIRKPACAYLPSFQRDHLKATICGTEFQSSSLLCENGKGKPAKAGVKLIDLNLDDTDIWDDRDDLRMVKCPAGHMVHDFLSCDVQSHCTKSSFVKSCRTENAASIPLFVCDNGIETVHYTLVCDRQKDCSDSSDETLCAHKPCSEEVCKNGQCIALEHICDGIEHCLDGSDEDCHHFLQEMKPLKPPPAIVHLDGRGGYTWTTKNASVPCPDTHFPCSDGICLPVYLRCNGVYDCIDRADEEGCDSFTCTGFYRCRGSKICLHADHVCDDVFQCPQRDDELLCDLKCPQGCLCQGLAFVCRQAFPAHNYTNLRYLDASHSGMAPDNLTHNFHLVSLTLSACGLEHLPNLTFPNLRTIDLSGNKLHAVIINVFLGSPSLHVIRLSNNPLTNVLSTGPEIHFKHVHNVDLSQTRLLIVGSEMMALFPKLVTLNISHTSISSFTSLKFRTSHLEILDVRATPVNDFPRGLLQDLPNLKTVYSSNYKLCCPAMLPPNFNVKSCHAPADEIASCDDLLRSSAYRVCLWVMSFLSLVGNTGSLVTRFRFQKETLKTSFGVFVTNLNIADLVMSVYLVLIGVADLMYKGSYLWKDQMWKESGTCKMAGFLSFISSEVSAFFICLITLDRFLALRFIFSGFRFSMRSALVTCAIAWVLGTILAAVPLLPMTSHWDFYGQTGICIPLPITRSSFKGHSYSFGIIVILNFSIFLLIAMGQFLIYRSVQLNSLSSAQNSSKDATIARRLTTIVLSDFLCWFPIGLLGLLASTGTSIPGEVNVGMAIFVLPLNSALNPFLYTLNVLLEKKRKAREARLLELLKKYMASERSVRNVGTMTTITSSGEAYH